MGFWKLFRVNNVAEEDERKMREYEKNPDGFVLNEEGDERDIKWWQRLIYDMRARIIYAIILALLLGLAIPLLINFLKDDKNNGTIYGSCLINKQARLQCLINNVNETTEDECIKAMCCWENLLNTNNTHPFKCYHSFPSAYQYSLTSVQSSSPDENPKVAIRAAPNHKNIMTDIEVQISWIPTNDVLNIELFDPKKFPDRKVVTDSQNFPEKFFRFEGNQLSVSYGEKDEIFYFQVVRNSSDGESESIFDTRIGPIHSHENFTTISAVLPTKHIYGLKGTQEVASTETVTYGIINGFENAELPFYMVLEKTGNWHAVLLETSYPIMVQVVNLPAVMFHIEGPLVSVDLKFFPGPTKDLVVSQLYNYLMVKNGKEKLYMPPYWGFGLHLCRQSVNGTDTFDRIVNLTRYDDEDEILMAEIPYDSDCIDENLRTPFNIDHERFDNVEEIVDYLITKKSRRILLVQNVAVPTEELDDSVTNEDLFVLSDEHELFEGSLNDVSVVYPNVFHENFQTWLNDSLPMENLTFHGMAMVDNFPKNENSSEDTCSPVKTRLGHLLQNPASPNHTWVSLCADSLHKINSNTFSNHLSVHNLYGHQALSQFANILDNKTENVTKERIVLVGASLWTESFLYGGSAGVQVPFTWEGLKDSLAQILRHFILFPFSGTVICGSHVPNSSLPFDNDLCLRWFQLGLILPFARHTYGVESQGPLEFTTTYQAYLIGSIKERYTYIPYYYTLFNEYQQNFIPPIRPMSFEFDSATERNITFGISDQFMIGSALMAAPILTKSLTRSAYFPAGRWFEINGNEVWSDVNRGEFKSLTGYITQTPLFLRSGYILPTLIVQHNNEEELTAEISRKGNYSILVASPSMSTDVSHGTLFVDDGVSATSVEDENNDQVVFLYSTVNATLHNFQIQSTCKLNTTLNISKSITQVKIFGFVLPAEHIIAITLDPPKDHELPPQYDFDPDIFLLRISNLQIDWCARSNLTISISTSLEPTR